MSIVKLKARAKISLVTTAAREIGIAYANDLAIHQNSDLSGIIGSMNAQETAINVMLNQQTTFTVQDTKDGVRDSITRDLAKAITGYMAIPVEPIRSAAIELDAVFAPFGVSMVDESYGVESGKINGFLAKATTPAMKEKTKLLPGIDLLLSSLAEAQADFETSYVAYEEAMADKKEVSSASALKPALVETINGKLVTLLRALVMLNETQYGHFATVVGQIIDRANSASKS